MKNDRFETKKMVLAALFMGIGIVLPFFTGQIPAIGNMLLPMHIPVLLCGFVCGHKYGVIVGGLLPLVRSLWLGAPVMFPGAVAMAVELAVYGLCAGALGKWAGRKIGRLYVALLITMFAGRIAWGIAMFGCFSILGNLFTWEFFIAQSFLNALPGIAIQLIIIPFVVRVVPQEYTLHIRKSCAKRFAPVVKEIRRLLKEKENGNILIAIDGKCASGKSTLGYYLKNMFDANLFHMDDFFLQKHQRTEARLAEVGGNVDYERFKEEVLLPLVEGKEVAYQRFDCGSLELQQIKYIKPKRVNIIEGSYSQHPYFNNPYDLKVFMEIPPEQQLVNIENRNGAEKLADFKERWIPKEEAYFKAFGIKENSDILVLWTKK